MHNAFLDTFPPAFNASAEGRVELKDESVEELRVLLPYLSDEQPPPVNPGLPRSCVPQYPFGYSDHGFMNWIGAFVSVHC